MTTLQEVQQALDVATQRGNSEDASALQQILDASASFRNAVQEGNNEDASVLADFLSQSGVEDAFRGVQQTGPGQFILEPTRVETLSQQPISRIQAAGLGGDEALFGIPGAAAAGLSALAGEGSFEENQEIQRALSERAIQERPGSFIAGAGVAGAGTLPLAAAQSARLAQAPGAVGTISRLAQLQRGPGLRTTAANVLRLGAGGAGAGGATATIQGQDPSEILQSTVLGGITGPLAAGVSDLLIRGGRAGFRALLAPIRGESRDLRTLARLSEALQVPAADLQAEASVFKELTGEDPRLVDLLDRQSVQSLRNLVRQQPAALNDIERRALENASTRASRFRDQLLENRIADTVLGSVQRQGALTDKLIGQIENSPVSISSGDFDTIFGSEGVLQRVGRSRRLANLVGDVREAISQGQDGGLTIRQVDDIRQLFGKIARSNDPDRFIFKEARDALSEVAADQIPAYRAALDRFGRRAQRIEGFEAGRSGATGNQAEFAVDADTANAFRRAGLRRGAVSQTVEEASRNAASAFRVATELAEDSARAQNLRAVLPEEKIDRLQALAKQQVRAFRNETSFSKALADDFNREIGSAIADVTALAVTGRATPGFLAGTVDTLRRTFPSINETQALSLSRILFDPDRTDEALRLVDRVDRGTNARLELLLAISQYAGAQGAVQTERSRRE